MLRVITPVTFLVFLSVALCPVQASPNASLHEYGEIAKKNVPYLKTIVIDAGHGGKDNGAVGGSAIKEKEVTLAIALRLQKLLTRSGFKVLMTRQDDRYLTLQDRAQIVNSNEADFFISIHANAAHNKIARGHETFYLSDPRNDPYDPEKMSEDGYCRYEHFCDDQKELGKVYLSLLDKASSEDRAKSIELAEQINDALRERLHARNRGVKRARFFVLKKTDIPAVLIEVGFLSNPKEEKKLGSSHYQRKIAQAIADGLICFRNGQYSANRVVGR